MLELRDVSAGYGERRVLSSVSLRVAEGGVFALLGRNGAGKSTTLKSVMGLARVFGGEIRFEDRPLTGLAPHDIARLGVAYVPETRDVFPSLTVRENLELGRRLGARVGGRDGAQKDVQGDVQGRAQESAQGRSQRDVQESAFWTLERALTFFPALAARLEQGAGRLSGGEQQMLAIARALLTHPRVLILDEPTEGLAPILVRMIQEKLAELAGGGLTILLVEQNVGFALGLAREAAVLGRGEIQWRGAPAALREDRATLSRWLGI